MEVRDIADYLEHYFPLKNAYDWDHCGLQIGSFHQKVQRIMIALTPDEEVINECIEKNIDLLITHHPLFFTSFNTIDYDSPEGRIIQKVTENHITVYSLHTCMDRGELCSMNQWLMEALGFNDYDSDAQEPFIKTASVDMTFAKLIDLVKEKLNLPIIRFVGDLEDEIHCIGVIGGSGADFMEQLENQVDCLITGDIKYHDGQWAKNHHLHLIDAGHFIEHIMTEKTKEILEKEFSCLIFESRQTDYFEYR